MKNLFTVGSLFSTDGGGHAPGLYTIKEASHVLLWTRAAAECSSATTMKRTGAF